MGHGRAQRPFGVTRVVSGGLDGAILDASLSSRHSVSPRLMLIPTIATIWTDGDYNRSYFGVSPAQASSAGISSFSPGSGFKDVSVGLTANYMLTERASLAASVTVSRLLGEVRDSPVVFDNTQPPASSA